MKILTIIEANTEFDRKVCVGVDVVSSPVTINLEDVYNVTDFEEKLKKEVGYAIKNIELKESKDELFLDIKALEGETIA